MLSVAILVPRERRNLVIIFSIPQHNFFLSSIFEIGNILAFFKWVATFQFRVLTVGKYTLPNAP